MAYNHTLFISHPDPVMGQYTVAQKPCRHFWAVRSCLKKSEFHSINGS